MLTADLIYLHLFCLCPQGLCLWTFFRFWSVLGLFFGIILVLICSVFWLWRSLFIIGSTGHCPCLECGLSKPNIFGCTSPLVRYPCHQLIEHEGSKVSVKSTILLHSHFTSISQSLSAVPVFKNIYLQPGDTYRVPVMPALYSVLLAKLSEHFPKDFRFEDSDKIWFPSIQSKINTLAKTYSSPCLKTLSDLYKHK